MAMELNLRAFEKERLALERRYAHAQMTAEVRQSLKKSEEKKAAKIKKALAENDIMRLLLHLDNTYHLAFVVDNIPVLKEHGLYEKTLLEAYLITRTNFANWSLDILRDLFRAADRGRLLSRCDPLPGNGPFTVYRGVSGKGAVRRVRGISWTASLDKAKWFAERFADLGNPAVYMATVEAEHVYAYHNGSEEQEFLCDIPKSLKLKKVWT
jgi:hypothetical protein